MWWVRHNSAQALVQLGSSGEGVMSLLGFDFNHGRLDVSHHPFCGGVPSDVRLTTRYNEQQLTQSLMSVIHETGHIPQKALASHYPLFY